MREGLDAVRVQCEVVEVRNLRNDMSFRLKHCEAKIAHVREVFDFRWVLVGDMLLNERRCLEQLLASLAPKLAFVFLFDILLSSFSQLPKCNISEIRDTGIQVETHSS